VLVIDTNNLNIVADARAYADVRERIRSGLGQGTFQPAFPQMPLTAGTVNLAKGSEALPGWRGSDSLREFVALTQSIGNLGVILSDGADHSAVQDALSICQRRLTRIAETIDLRLSE
jgi:hypothetical protein